jgi:hypothetical protein
MLNVGGLKRQQVLSEGSYPTESFGDHAGRLLRSINKAGRIWGDGFTPKVIWAIVKPLSTLAQDGCV